MINIIIKPLESLADDDLHELVKESLAEKLSFVVRLSEEYRNGVNRFAKQGEQFFAAYDEGRIVGVCGLNQDPYSGESAIGRVRRMYVLPAYRRFGIGQQLVHRVIKEARNHYSLLVLRTDNPIADVFYRKIGFIVGSNYGESTHFMKLDKQMEE